MMPKTIKTIQRPPVLERKMRVAAYARVSCGKDAMMHSLSAQVSRYSDLIQANPDWLYAGVYMDEAKTGTKDSREDFQRLLDDCRAGNIDMVITKSISRFARNTVMLLETVRELKALNVDIFFEEQNIHTMSSDGELMLSILASYAQEESRSVSENQKWRIRRNFEEGKPWDGALLGYRLRNGKYEIVPEEAAVVRRIFSDYLAGKGYTRIANELNADGVCTRFHGRWCKSSVEGTLKNYSYTGNLLLQKTFRKDHLSKKTMINRGELPQYHAEGTHEPIVSLEDYQAVQAEIRRRAEHFNIHRDTPKHYPFTGKLTCGCCGSKYRRKTIRSGIVWICGTYNTQGKVACPSKQVPEPTLEQVAAEVLDGRDISCIAGITVHNGNRLVFRLADGTTTERIWKDRSRAESWTPEKKEAARQKELERRRGNA